MLVILLLLPSPEKASPGFVLFCVFKLKVFQANHGKAETCAHQRESWPAEDPHHGSAQERCEDINIIENMIDLETKSDSNVCVFLELQTL